MKKKTTALLLTAIAAATWFAAPASAQDASLPAHRLDHITAYPVNKIIDRPAVTVDGNLEEWQSDAFVTIVADPSMRDDRAARVAVAYDDAGLYVGMDVIDDTPLQNIVDPLSDPFRGWRGDSMQMRFVTADGQMSHWTWWYFSERGQPAVDVRYGYDFTGVVTRVDEEAHLKFREQDRGYSFELFMPWDLLHGKGAAGAEWKTVLEPHWNVFGDEVVAFSDCITREENAMYKRPHLWGALRFAGDDNAEQLLAVQKTDEARRAGIGREDVPTWGVPISIDVPADGYVSMAITSADGHNVRTLLAKAGRSQGPSTEYWDGLDDDGQPLSPGIYGVKVLTHQGITPKFVTSVMNSGTPPWITADGKGSWGADHGSPLAAAAGPDGWTFLLWSGCEAGFDLVGVNAEGYKQWGTRLPFSRHGNALAYCNGQVVVAESNGLLLFDAATGATAAFPDGSSNWSASNWAGAGAGVAGLVATSDALYIAVKNPGVILALDPTTFQAKQSWTLSNAGALAFDVERQRLYAVADGKVWCLDLPSDDTPRLFIAEGLEMPAGIAVDAAGNVYVAQQGTRMNVAVFNADGQPAGTIGKDGGRAPVGKYDPSGMLRPAGISVDTLGRLWVPEADTFIRRISQWDTQTGKLLDEFFGAAAYAVMMAPDPEKPENVYLHNSRFIVDYEKGTSYPDAILYRPGWRGATMSGSEAGYGFMGATFTISRYQGKTFAMNGHGGVFAYGESEFTPLVQVGSGGNNIFQFGGTFFPGASLIKGRRIYRPEGLTPGGIPIYPKPEEAPPVITGDGPMNRYSNWMDVWPSFESDWQEFYAIASLPDTKFGGIPDGGGGDGIFRFNREGEILWRYPNVRVFYAIKDQRLAGPGDLMGAVRIAGLVNMPEEKGGEIICIGNYRAYFGLISGGGLFIDKISDDKGKGLAPGFDTFFIENFSGYFFKHPQTGKVYLFCGDVDGRILELQGLENVRVFDGGNIGLDESEVARLAAARAAAAGSAPVAVTDLTPVRLTAAPAPDAASFPAAAMRQLDLGEGRRAELGLAYDQDFLYGLFQVDDPSPWRNGATDWRLLFKGGDAVDIQLGTDDRRPLVRVFVAPMAGDGKALAVGMWPLSGPAGVEPDPYQYLSPVGQESFAHVARIDTVQIQAVRGDTSYTLTVAIPWTALGVAPPAAGATLRGDMGILFSDQSGTRTIRRLYLFNTETAVVDDIPSEVRLRPQFWAPVRFE
jgi:DNA-binding beta-propeller fold protein YncE